MDLIALLTRRVDYLTIALRKSAIEKEGLEAELADRPLLPAVFRRLRDRDKAIASLRKANERLGEKIRVLRARNARLEAWIAKLRTTRAVLSRALYGSKSEKQDTPGTGRKRGQQRGAPGHGRTQRPVLEEKEEPQKPPEDALVCSCCGKPYVANGERSSTVIEIEVKAHTRRIVRPRYRRGCDCASSPLEVTAPPPARLFPRTPCGTTVWARILFERFACFRPLRRGRGVDGGPGAGNRAGDGGRQRAPLPATVRTPRQGDPRAPERNGGAPRRRDRLAHPVAERDRPLAARVAVDLGQRRGGSTSSSTLAQRRGPR